METRMKIPAGAWIVVADGQKALFLRNAGTAVDPALHLIEKDVLDNPPTREQGADRPGRYPDAGQGRSSVEQTDWHEFEKARFAKEIAAHLNHAAGHGAFDDLLLVAPASTLGELRPALDQNATAYLRAEIEKDLTNHPVPKILAHIEDIDG
jgi:protein required for attachment to host cells